MKRILRRLAAQTVSRGFATSVQQLARVVEKDTAISAFDPVAAARNRFARSALKPAQAVWSKSVTVVSSQTKGVVIVMKKIKSQPNPSLRFSPTAWAKLQYLHDAGDTEL